MRMICFSFTCLILSQKRNAFMELRKNTQKEIDTPLIQKLKEADPLLLKYLASTFTLQNNTKPHELKF